MNQKFYSEPSRLLDGGYDVVRKNDVTGELEPLEHYQSEDAAKKRAAELNEAYNQEA